MGDATGGYPVVDVAGEPFEMGLGHGRAIAGMVRLYRDLLLQAFLRDRGQSAAGVLAGVRRFRPLFERHCPHLLDEVAGLAAGAGIEPDEALLLQIRGEAAGVAGEGCTTFALGPGATASGEILIGQTSDMEARMESVGIVLRAPPARRPAMLLWTFSGQLGYHGMNSEGVAHFANALAGGPAWRMGLPHYPLKRLLLEGATVADCLRLFATVPLCSSGNYMLSGGCGRIADVEATPEGFGLLQPGPEGFLVHTNHFLHPDHRTEATHAAAAPDSVARLERLRALVEQRRGEITVEHVKAFLADHAGFPHGICRHAEAGNPGATKSVAGLIAEPAHGRLHVCRGNPCEGRWQSVSFLDCRLQM